MHPTPPNIPGLPTLTYRSPDGLADREPLQVLEVTVDGDAVLVSRWRPTPEERAALAAGSDVWLWHWGYQHAPVALGVVPPASPLR